MSTTDQQDTDEIDELLPEHSKAKLVLYYAIGASAAGLVFGGLQLTYVMPSWLMAGMGAIGLATTISALVITDV